MLKPIEIETTQIGMDVNFLVNTLESGEGIGSVNPYNYVSFRILNQMANLMQGSREVGDIYTEFM
jgi:hypothetical protein